MKIKKLTQEQEEKLSFYREKWLNKIFNYELYKEMTEESVISKMKELYKFCNLKEPIVLLARSPIEAQLMVNIFKNQLLYQVWDQVGDQIEDRAGSQVWDQIRDQIRDQVCDQVWDQVGDQVWDQVMDQVEDQVCDQVEDRVGDQICDQVRRQIKRNKKITYHTFSSYINYSDFGWLAFYDFFLHETSIIKNKHLTKAISFVENSFLSIQLDGLCVVSKYPCFINRNRNNDLHNINDYAIKFEDGYGQHYFNGVFIGPKLFNSLIKKEYTFKNWTKEKNEETKALVLAFYEEKFGGEFVYNFLAKNLKEIDTFIDKKEDKYLKNTKGMNIGVYTLFKGNINNTNIAYVRCYCPSSDRMFFLGVHPDFNNAKDAIASLCQIPKKLKNNLISIARQGEIFSFNFDEEGTEMLKNNKLSKKDIHDVVSLTGDEYFNKIKFEY